MSEAPQTTVIIVDGYALADTGDKRNPRDVMDALGITYERGGTNALMDPIYRFEGCANIPDDLPAGFRVFQDTPLHLKKPNRP